MLRSLESLIAFAVFIIVVLVVINVFEQYFDHYLLSYVKTVIAIVGGGILNWCYENLMD